MTEYEINCSMCGKKDNVPFKPRYDTALLCKECYKNKGTSKPTEPKEDFKMLTPTPEKLEEFKKRVENAEPHNVGIPRILAYPKDPVGLAVEVFNETWKGAAISDKQEEAMAKAILLVKQAQKAFE